MKQFHFIKYTKLWFVLSLATILLGVGAMIYNKVNYGEALQFGIDFNGGSLMEFRFDNPTDVNSLFSAIEAGYPKSVSQITVTDQNTYLVQAKEISEDQLKQVQSSLGEKLGKFEMLRFTTIGPKIGGTMKQKALMALAVAMAAIILYLAFAFRKVPKRVSPWRFGICAVIALLHDALTVVGIFALMEYEINAFFITALLTVIGFSVHDTIVVFDRIRENLKKQTRDETFADIADISLNQTLTRSINTSLSTLFPLIALYIWGAESIRTFVFALIIGIFVGTYSSIFIASPLLVLWQEKAKIR
jgi:preprotein translocase subunit SecF